MRAAAVRSAVALLLVTGLVGVSHVATAAPPGGGTSHIAVDVVVVGTPPPNTSITVIHSDQGTPVPHVVDLDDTGGVPDIGPVVATGVGHPVYVDPNADGGADSIDYSCTVVGLEDTVLHPSTRCDELAPSNGIPVVHAYTQFWETEGSARSDVTITLTFDPDPPAICDGRIVTVDLNEGGSATSGPDVILGTPGRDVVGGQGGSDVICGSGGNDVLRGGLGQDRLLGGPGPDRLEGGAAADRLLGHGDGDTLLGQRGPDVLDGGAQRDSCNGGRQSDTAVRCEARTSVP